MSEFAIAVLQLAQSGRISTTEARRLLATKWGRS